MALNQDQPLANSRFYAEIEARSGQRRELRNALRFNPRRLAPQVTLSRVRGESRTWPQAPIGTAPALLEVLLSWFLAS
jgi:hypothetical protein